MTHASGCHPEPPGEGSFAPAASRRRQLVHSAVRFVTSLTRSVTVLSTDYGHPERKECSIIKGVLIQWISTPFLYCSLFSSPGKKFPDFLSVFIALVIEMIQFCVLLLVFISCESCNAAGIIRGHNQHLSAFFISFRQRNALVIPGHTDPELQGDTVCESALPAVHPLRGFSQNSLASSAKAPPCHSPGQRLSAGAPDR